MTDHDKPQPEQGGKFPFAPDEGMKFPFDDRDDTTGHAAEAGTTADDVEIRRQVYDEYVAREIPVHETMDHPLEIDPFDENDVEGHMPRCKKC